MGRWNVTTTLLEIPMLRTSQRVVKIQYNKIIQNGIIWGAGALEEVYTGTSFSCSSSGRRSGRIGRLSLGRSAVFSDLQLKAPAGWGEPGSGEVVEGLRLVIPVLTCRNL